MIKPKVDGTIYLVTKVDLDTGIWATAEVFFTHVREHPKGYYASFTTVNPYTKGAASFGQGGCMLLPYEPEEYGVQKIVATDKKWKPPVRWYPQPGNKGYDLLC